MCKNKKLLWLSCVVLASLAGNASAGLVAQWNLDGNGLDSGPHGKDGTPGGTVAAIADRFGNPNGAMSFDGGGSDKITIADTDSVFDLTGSITITGWVFLDTTRDISPTTRNGRILAKFAGGGSRGWSSSVEKNKDGVILPAAMDVSSNASSPVGLHDDVSITTDTWLHYAAVYTSGATPKMEIYLNANSAISETSGVPASQYNPDGIDITIGGRASCGDCGWVGALDDVRLYDEALTQSQIQAIMNIPEPVSITMLCIGGVFVVLRRRRQS